MKRLIVWFSIVVILFSTIIINVGCSSTHSTDEDVFTSSTSSFSSSDSYVKVYNEFMENVKYFNVNKAHLTRVEILSPEIGTLSSTDASICLDWINLLSDMEVSPIPYGNVDGSGYSLIFHFPQKAIRVGFFVGGAYINADMDTSKREVMLEITNYHQLYQRFVTLEKKMGLNR